VRERERERERADIIFSISARPRKISSGICNPDCVADSSLLDPLLGPVFFFFPFFSYAMPFRERTRPYERAVSAGKL